MNELEQLKKENTELKSKIFNISKAWNLASSDISALFETQPMNRCDGSYDIDGQSCHELFMVIDKAPVQHLAEIKADAIMEVANNWIIRKDSDYNIRRKLTAISNSIRGESK